jgi:hypothetical protein
MAEADTERLKSLIESVRPDDEAVRELLRRTAGDRLWETLYPDKIDEAEVPLDRAAELQDKWGTERGQIWRAASHRILCEDCTRRHEVASVNTGVKVHQYAGAKMHQ